VRGVNRISIVPTIDDERPGEVEYRDWTPAQTRIVVYTSEPLLWPFDIPAADGEAARAHCEAHHGRVLEYNEVPGRFFCRVLRRVA
jgi:hypothetical protein